MQMDDISSLSRKTLRADTEERLKAAAKFVYDGKLVRHSDTVALLQSVINP